jgi:phage terminase small subunit
LLGAGEASEKAGELIAMGGQGSGGKPKLTEAKSRDVSRRDLPAPLPIGGRSFPVEAPADLSPAAQAMWATVVPMLIEANVLARIDEAAMRILCTQWARAEEFREVLEHGLDDELPELGARLEENRQMLRAIKRSVAARLAAQSEGMAAAREALKTAVEAGESAEVFRNLTALIEKIEQATVQPAELAAVARLEQQQATLEEYVDLRRKGRKVALGSTGQLTAHPLLAEERAAHAMVLKAGSSFALTPTDRARLGLAALEGQTLRRELEQTLGPSTRARRRKGDGRKGR